MPSLPATCVNCGLIFNTDLGGRIGTYYQGTQVACPRCRRMTPAHDGFFVLMGATVEFITADDVERDEKLAFLDAVREVAEQNRSIAEAINRLADKSPRGRALLREWGNFGIGVFSALCTAAMLVMAIHDEKRNVDPGAAALTTFEECVSQKGKESSSERWTFSPEDSLRPQARGPADPEGSENEPSEKPS